MNILWSIHLYPPHHNCGAEWMAHHFNRFFISKGHAVKVLLHQANQFRIDRHFDFDGVAVFPPDNQKGLYDWADIVFTHLDFSQETIYNCERLKKPCIFVTHNTSRVYDERLKVGRVGVVYNSEYAKALLNYPNASVVVPPPVDWRYYDQAEDPANAEYITQIGLSMNKGGEVFYKLAEAFPNKKFLGVKGSYDPQIMDSRLKNVTIIENTSDILPIYKKTRVLLMPSTYESWGRTATEAMCNGIPVVCTPTFGLKENAGYAGLYCELDSLEPWIKAIKKLDSPKQYQYYSNLSERRSRELDPLPHLNALNEFLTKMLQPE